MTTADLLLLHKAIAEHIYFDPVAYLPNELVLNVFSHLSPQDVLTASRVSRPWRQLTRDEPLWRDNFHREGWALERSKIQEEEQKEKEKQENIKKTAARHSRPGQLVGRRVSRKRQRVEAFSEDETVVASASAPELDCNDGVIDMEGVEDTTPRESTGSEVSTLTEDISIETIEAGDSRAEGVWDPALAHSALDLAPHRIVDSNAANKATVQEPRVSWPWLYKQRRRLESNWDAGKYKMFRLPHPAHPDDGHKECVYTIQHSGSHLVSGSRDKTIRCWNLDSQELRIPPLVGHEASVLCLQFDEREGDKHDIIVSGGSDNYVIVWRFSNGKLLHKMTAPHTESVLNLRFDDRYLVTCSKDKTIKIWNRHEITKNNPIIPARVIPEFADGPDLLSPFTLLDTLYGHQAAVNAVQISNDIIVSASGDRTIKSWDIHSTKEGPSHRKSYTGHTKGIACVQFDGRRIVSGSSDNSVRIFDYDTTAEVACLDGHSNLVRTVQARFGDMDTVTNEELAAEAKAADRKFLKALDEGLQPVEPSQVRRSRNPGSNRTADMLSYGTKIPPGGGGSRWSKIVSGSYDETIIIWKRDPNKAGKWRPNVRLQQAPSTSGNSNNRAVRVNGGVAANGPAHANTNLAPQGGQVGQVAPNATQQAHAMLQQAQNGLALANAAANHHAMNHNQPPSHAQIHAMATAQASLNQHMQILASQQQQQQQHQSTTSHGVAHVQVASATQAGIAQTGAPAPAQLHHGNPQAPPQTNGQIPAQQAAVPAAQPVQGAGATQPPAQGGQIPAGGAPQPHHHHGHHHHHHGHAGHAHGGRSESNRVFKLQFDARRIIACSQNKVIVGWDFANGDKDLERIGDWSRETN